MPTVLKSVRSASRRTSRFSTRVDIRPSTSWRSPLTTTCTPAAAPSRSSAITWSVITPPSTSPSVERKPSQRSISTSTYGGRSSAGSESRCSPRSANPRRPSSSCRSSARDTSRLISRTARSDWVRPTTAPQCGSRASAISAPLPQSMPYRCRSADVGSGQANRRWCAELGAARGGDRRGREVAAGRVEGRRARRLERGQVLDRPGGRAAGSARRVRVGDRGQPVAREHVRQRGQPRAVLRRDAEGSLGCGSRRPPRRSVIRLLALLAGSGRHRGRGRPARLHGTGQASASAAGRSPVSAPGRRPPTRPHWKGTSVDAPLRT